MVVAVIGILPGAKEIIDQLRLESTVALAPWVYATFTIGLVQMAYALYCMQLVDWSTLWAAMIASVAVAMIYAAALGLTMTSQHDGEFLQWLGLEELHRNGYAAPWCLVMVLIICLIVYFLFLTATRWKKAYRLMAKT